ncbi:hypothetical protein SAMN05443637_120105 [Pseudonocardia thermophila]|uniref:Ribbon-helix-helix protein, copG family n=1 Tax=Pseudonocardia thermophila TaxID=1848 RepID=A0A1M6YM40_PSETH|nr:hypothetical protein [Pseudonocardia thermophila]SHL19155.1 hypothetical protein SAMN05443637_120105 [Pseudonocardia thermophila]
MPQPREPHRRARHRSPEPARRSRRKASEPEPGPFDEAPPDPELDSYLAALAPTTTPDDTRFGTAQVFTLRLPELRMEQLRRLAQERGVSPSALAVDWVIERLDQEDTATGPLPPVLDDGEPAPQERRRGLRRFGWR